MTTHLLDSGFNHDCLELEYRLSSRVGTHFFNVLKEIYPKKQFIISDPYLLDIDKLRDATGNETIISGNVPQQLDNHSVEALLYQAQYSFFYSPFKYSSIDQSELYTQTHNKDDPCLSYVHPWTRGDFPLLIVLLPDKFQSSPFIRILRSGKYLFFVPSQHSILNLSK